MTNLKRIFVWLVAVIMIISCFSVFPITTQAATSGTCGNNLTWSISGSTLTIRGSGDMYDYDRYNPIPPWNSYSTKIKTISLPTGITHIGDYAFYQYTNLTSIALPSSVKTIGEYAFNGCTALTSITIPENVTAIGFNAFSNCKNVSTINFNAITCGDLAGSMNPFYGVGQNVGGFTLNIGANVTRIPGNFVSAITSTTSLKSIKFLGNKVTHIGKEAFFNCKNLTYIALPTSIKTIETGAFSGTGLTSALYYGTKTQWQNVSVGALNGNLTSVIKFHESHTWGATTTVKAATCTTAGQTKSSCTVCGTITTQETAALGHVCTSWTIIKEATCTEDGQKSGTCTRCKTVINTVIPANGHSVLDKNSWLQDTSAHWNNCLNCPEKINKETHKYNNSCDFSCNTCGYERIVTHSYSTVWSFDSSNHWYTCTVCKTTKDKSAHVYDHGCDTTCNICGYTRTITHSYSTTWFTDSNNHWHACNVCGTKKDNAAHIYDNVCDTNCNICEYTRTITHSYSTTWSTDSNNHWHACNVCGTKKDNASHIYDNACDINCNICGYWRTITHNYQSTWSTDGINHWHKCTICKVKKDIAPHHYDNNCDASCNSCGAIREIVHNYQNVWSQDATGHWHECSVCGDKKDNAQHLPSAAATETTPQLCTICEYIITPILGHTHNYSDKWESDRISHWYACTGCSEQKKLTNHSYDNTCDDNCNVCGTKRIVSHNYTNSWIHNGTNHWYQCTVCKTQKNIASHNYDNTCDSLCDTCGYVRSVTHSYADTWLNDIQNHWLICKTCGMQKDLAPHNPGAEATENVPQTCTICDYILVPSIGHIHSADNEWLYNSNEHWRACTGCNENQNQAVHKYTNDSCSICGYKTTNEPDNNATLGDNDAVETPPAATSTPITSDNTENTPNNHFPWWILIIVVLAIIIITIVIQKKKQSIN